MNSIAIIDTGIHPHVDFMCPTIRVRAFLDLVGGRKLPYDDNGHGTFVAGVAAASGLSFGGKRRGSAPNADIVAIKAMNGSGEGGTITLLRAMQWIADNCRRYRITTVCMSFGCPPQKNDPLSRGARALVERGITVVGAVGNGGEGTVLSPAFSDAVIAVGACGQDGRPAKFSSRGVFRGMVKPDFFAKGVGVLGLSHKKLGTGMNGTSVACPEVYILRK